MRLFAVIVATAAANTLDMAPSVVAGLFADVEKKWVDDVVASKDLGASPVASVVKSCSTLVKSIVGGSSGDKERVESYMKMVCRQEELGEGKGLCASFASQLTAYLTDDVQYNRDSTNDVQFCTTFYPDVHQFASSRLAAEKAKKGKGSSGFR